MGDYVIALLLYIRVYAHQWMECKRCRGAGSLSQYGRYPRSNRRAPLRPAQRTLLRAGCGPIGNALHKLDHLYFKENLEYLQSNTHIQKPP